MNGEHNSHLPPPPNHNQHQHQRPYRYHPPSSSSASFKGCCCCLFALLVFLGLLALAVVLIIVLALKPKKPQFELQQVEVQTIGIAATPSASSSLPPTVTMPPPAASLSLTIKMVFTAQNPNKVGIKYSGTQFYVMYGGVPLGVANVPGFYQPAHSIRSIETAVVVDHVNLVEADATDIVKDASINDRIELRITGDVGAKIRILDFTSPRVKVSVDCAIVISPRKRSLTYKQCGVDGVNV
ncbi:hypothetical protein GIB67_017860 [Kingdonia uniflora]|uniref:Late embryogenesis abundant protein LEA-2 subgroup domain-containing protein n=1 Tax=Kingdonia uniflora TaxID=39325 RepID=A0A7J7MKQ4_9MAGN|nr:hypothetical protein GIB67_017860 [Kingdonia uniflora]